MIQKVSSIINKFIVNVHILCPMIIVYHKRSNFIKHEIKSSDFIWIVITLKYHYCPWFKISSWCLNHSVSMNVPESMLILRFKSLWSMLIFTEMSLKLFNLEL